MKVAGKKEPASTPIEPISEPADDAGFGDSGGEGFGGEPAPADDKPFDDTPFDAGVEANEEEDPQKYIEQLSGKLGQTLRDFTNNQGGQPDFDLEKFAINSVISATHTADMDEGDRNDIIKKINTAGGNDTEGSDNYEDNNGEDDFSDPSNDGDAIGNGDDNGSGFGDEEDLEEMHLYENKIEDGEEMDNLFCEPKKNNMFQPGSNDGLKENLINSKKNRIFDKNYMLNKLHETLNQEDMKNSEPEVVPVTKPTTTPTEKPVRTPKRHEPFRPMPATQPDPKAEGDVSEDLLGKRPKAMKDYQTYHNSFSSAVQTAREMAENRGYEVNDDDWWRDIAMGPRKPQDGDTNRYTLPLYFNGKEQRKTLNIQVYGMGNKYELNAYIN